LVDWEDEDDVWENDDWGNDDVTTYWDKTSDGASTRSWYMTDEGADVFPDGDYAWRLDANGNLEGVNWVYQDGITLHAGVEYLFSIDFWALTGRTPTLWVQLVKGETVNLRDAYQDSRFNPSFDRQHRFRTGSMLATPMRNSQGQVIGVTQAINKRGSACFDREDEEILLAFSSQASIAVENARYLELQRRTFETLINGQAVAIDVRDHITAGHSRRVTAFAVEIGRALGWKGQDLGILRYAGLLHDQGKLGVPDEILLKPAQLSEWEFQIIQSHAQKTKVILNAVRPLFPRTLRTVPEIAASHHEKLDGSGYPDGLRGDAISPGARIVAVADIFDALTSVRPYRNAAPDAVVVEILRRDAENGKLDPKVVGALEKALPRVVHIRKEINEKIQQQKGICRVTGRQKIHIPAKDSGE